MKEVIYLRVSRNKVEGMTKNLPNLYSGEIPVKLTIIVKPEAFREPVIEKEVVIDDWSEGVNIDDVEFSKNIITQAEAGKIREMRLQRMSEILTSQGYKVTKEEQ